MLTPAELVWLIAAVAKGDEAAFERLYAATRAKLFGVVLRILRRQDLAEESFRRPTSRSEQCRTVQSGARFADYMDGVDRAQPAIDVVRKKTEISIEEEPTAMEVAADSPDPLARREMTEELKRLLDASAVSSRIGRSWCSWPITTAGAASSSPPNSRRR